MRGGEEWEGADKMFSRPLFVVWRLLGIVMGMGMGIVIVRGGGDGMCLREGGVNGDCFFLFLCVCVHVRKRENLSFLGYRSNPALG